MPRPYQPPFPYFGAKSVISPLVWEKLGDPPSYIEPFAGSMAVLFNRPNFNHHAPQWELVNDLDHFVANFWRATQHAPQEVVQYCDWPTSEVDVTARHRWLWRNDEFHARMMDDPEYYDAKVAGWWVYGLCNWISGGWCGDRTSPPSNRLPQLQSQGMMTNTKHLPRYFEHLRQRLRSVKVTCHDWRQVLCPCMLSRTTPLGIFLDPPYSNEERAARCYKHDDGSIGSAVRNWAVENGENLELRIALCGYEGEHEMPSDWECVAWNTGGGPGAWGMGKETRRSKDNSNRERIWFSPGCNRSGLF